MPVEHGFSSALLHVLSTRIGWTSLNRPDRRAFQELSRGVAELSKRFTTHREELDAQYLTDERLRLAYLSYFMPVNAAKIQMILNELPERDAMIQGDGTLRVLDLGSGPGTGALAVLDWLQRPGRRRRAVEMMAMDVAGGALDEAQRLWQAYCRMDSIPCARLDCRRVDLERNGWLKSIEQAEPYHLIMVANTLNELFQTSHDPVQRQIQMIQALLDRLHRNGSLVIVEPALRQTARNLHRVRDRLVARQLCTVYSPCLHECSCPALLKEDDWCHEERPWMPPPWVAAIDQEVGFIKDALKFSYGVFRKDGATIVPRNADVFRVVSDLRRMKGDTRAWLCNEAGRSEVGRLDRDETDSNAPVDDWHRGAIVHISGIEKKSTARLGRIQPTSTVRTIRPV